MDPRWKLVALGAAVVLSIAACGSSDDKSPTAASTPTASAVPTNAPHTGATEDERIAAAQENGFSDQDYKDYNGDIQTAFKVLNIFWRATLPVLYHVKYQKPLAFIPYTNKENAPKCGGTDAPIGNAFFCRPDNFIAWDDANLVMPFWKNVGDFGAVFVMAHEWGHSIQQQVGAVSKYTIWYELQADCYAGAWSGTANKVKLLEPGDVEEALHALKLAGDLKGTPWFDANAHGTAEQRIKAFSIGFKKGVRGCTGLTHLSKASYGRL